MCGDKPKRMGNIRGGCETGRGIWSLPRLSQSELSRICLYPAGAFSRRATHGRHRTAQYQALTDKKTAPDSPELESRHVRGRTIYAVPDRVVYGYFDMLTRLVVEAGR